MEFEKHLDLTITENKGEFAILIRDPETSVCDTISGTLSPDEQPNELPELAKDIGGNICSWIRMWADAMKMEKNNQ